MIFFFQTKNNLSDRRVGPIDFSGFPTLHKDFMVEAESVELADDYFEGKFPGNVLYVGLLDIKM